jgi:hypothetical protein
MANCLVTLAKPTIFYLKPLLARVPYFRAKFKTSQYNYSDSDYIANHGYNNMASQNSRGGGPKRFSTTKAGWTRAEDTENVCTIGGGRESMLGSAGRNDRVMGVTGDNASDEEILTSANKDGTVVQEYKMGIIKTVDVDVNVSQGNHRKS